MKRLCAFAIMLALLTAACLAGEQDFILVNRTGYPIYSVYVSPHNADDWEEDIMGMNVLPNNSQVRVRFSREEDTEYWDLRVDFRSSHYDWTDGWNLYRIRRITLTNPESNTINAIYEYQ